MTRIIRFRAWHKKRKQWVYFTLNHGGVSFNLDSEYTIFDADLEPWQQFTGLFDKNGKEIYEGDIQDCGEYTDGSGRCLYVVSWGEKHAQFVSSAIRTGEPYRGQSGIEDSPVIGNIYENPELLK